MSACKKECVSANEIDRQREGDRMVECVRERESDTF